MGLVLRLKYNFVIIAYLSADSALLLFYGVAEVMKLNESCWTTSEVQRMGGVLHQKKGARPPGARAHDDEAVNIDRWCIMWVAELSLRLRHEEWKNNTKSKQFVGSLIEQRNCERLLSDSNIGFKVWEGSLSEQRKCKRMLFILNEVLLILT